MNCIASKSNISLIELIWRNFNELGSDGFHAARLHLFWKTKPAKPVIEIVRQHADLLFDLIGPKIRAAHFPASKPVLRFFNKV
jgi:hypothetical protein